ncbi:MAG TPA: protein rep, partial [Candidatus Thermoplasmatota archaeon]|nr:protein rep [Candidatus Thermoplasmatota archaeon]
MQPSVDAGDDHANPAPPVLPDPGHTVPATTRQARRRSERTLRARRLAPRSAPRSTKQTELETTSPSSSAHSCKQLDGGTGVALAWGESLLGIAPSIEPAGSGPSGGWASFRDRGGRERTLPIWSSAQIGEAIAQRALIEIQREVQSPAAARPRRRRRPGRASVPDEELTEDDLHAWKPAAQPLLERARIHEFCVGQDPTAAPPTALVRVHHDTCGSDFVTLRSCALRSCPKCNGERFAKTLEDIAAWMEGAKLGPRDVRLLTLTMRNAPNLAEGVDRIKENVKLLRRRPFFKRYVRGGVVAIQWTRYDTTSWHVHAHLVLVGVYLERDHVVNAWREICGDDALGK